jgi:dihydrofolate synthase/folylpolyglutamate synthase
MSESLVDWLDKLEQRHPIEIDLGLERCSQVFASMGSPAPAPRIITVAGTNGKGSVVAFLAAMFSAMGYRCGTYTSPHLLAFNERVLIDGNSATDEQFVRAFELTEAAREDTSLTYFEFTTLAAFQLMRESRLDIAILEVGLGGRLSGISL